MQLNELKNDGPFKTVKFTRFRPHNIALTYIDSDQK